MPTIRQRWPELGFLCALLSISAGACRPTPEGCEYDSVERCLWSEGLEPSATQDADPGQGQSPLGEGSGTSPRGSADVGDTSSAPALPEQTLSELDQTVLALIDAVGVGLEWELVQERALTLCEEHPKLPEGSEGQPQGVEAWSCRLERLLIGGRALTLEAGEGVLALSARELSGEESAARLEAAVERYSEWCEVGGLEAVESKLHDDFFTCGLKRGPLLIIGRFPNDLGRDRWQISITVVDPG